MHTTGIHQFPASAEEKSPFVYAHGMTFWEFFDRNPDQRRYFDDYMAVRRKGLATWHETFPMATVLGPGAKRDEDAVLLVDVGGNWGHEIVSFHAAYPDLPGRLVLQDLPAMIEKVAVENPPKGVELMQYDFLTPQPVKGTCYFVSSSPPTIVRLTRTTQAHAHTTSAISATTGRTPSARSSSLTPPEQWNQATRGC